MEPAGAAPVADAAMAEAGEPSGQKKRASSAAQRQLRELAKLMPWNWDSRVEEHPPGEKAMHDFENVLSFQLDTGRRRRPPAHLQGTPADGGAAASPAVPAGGGSGAKPRARASAERGMKRPSPSPASGNLKAGRKAGKAARAEPSPGPVARPPQQASPLAAAAQPAPAAAAAAVLAAAPAAASPAAPPAGVEATPAVRQQAPPAQAGGEGPSPGLPGSAITPAAALLGRLAGTPATAASDPPTAGTGAAVALADGQFLPTPAPIPLGLAAAVQPGSAAGVPGDAAAAAGGAEAPAAEPSQPAARLTGFKRKAGSAPADQPEEVPGGDSASMAVDDVAAVAAPPDTAAPMDADAPAECDAPISASSADPAAPPAPAAEAPDSAACCGAAAQLPTPMAAQAPARGALPLGVADVPTPVVAAFAAADQLLYHQPRPRSCPPLFKPPVESPLGKRWSPASEGKENRGGRAGAAARLTPRTAEPAVPQPAVLSAWKQQQLAQLSAGFHSRQRRLLELLSACNRAQQQAAPPGAGEPPKPAAGGRAGSGSAQAPAAKPPLGPRAAAVAAARTWGGGAELGKRL